MRLRMKVWTDPDTDVRYLCPAAFMKRGHEPFMMSAYAMNDEDTKVIELTMEEWDSLPFFYFKEDGECTDRPKRNFDIV